MTRLDEFNKEEWFDIARILKPGLSHEEYDLMWNEFMELKKLHEGCPSYIQ